MAYRSQSPLPRPADGGTGSLPPVRAGSQERLIGRDERDAAMTVLDTALHDHRIDFREYEQARELVLVSRTGSDIRAAMAGIDQPPPPNQRLQVKASETKAKAVDVAREGGRRIGKSVLRFVLALCLLFTSLVLVMADHQNIALVVALSSIAVYFTSVLALFRPSGEAGSRRSGL